MRGVTSPPPMRTFVGLDCGGSTSRVLAVDERGEAVFRGQSGAANLLATPLETIRRSLRQSTEGCPPATAACGAFAGLVGPDQRRQAVALLGEFFPGAQLRAEPDYAAAHAAAPEGTDVTIVAGTGSLVCGHDAEGRLTKTGVGGYLLGDEGSGFRFGRAALVHFLGDSIERSDGLGEKVAGLFGTSERAEIVAAVYRAPSPQVLLARLMPAFAADLRDGLAYAESVAEREEDELATTVALHAVRHLANRSTVGIALAGGVWKASERFERLLRESLERRMPGVRFEVRHVVRPPVQGSVELAREIIDGNGK